MIDLHFKAEGPSEELFMSALNVILEKIASLTSTADNERAEVATALGGLTASIESLKAQLASGEAVPVESITQALDGLNEKIKAIYTPEPSPEPAPPVE